MARTNERGRGPRGPQQHGQQARPQKQGGGQGTPGWTQMRDAIRRDVELATTTLAFAQTLATRLDSQRRLFTDFPRVTEELRSGALERLSGALERLYEGGNNVTDLTRFLRDLPLATAHLAQAEAQARKAQEQAAQRRLKPLEAAVVATATGEAAVVATATGEAALVATAAGEAAPGVQAEAVGVAAADAEPVHAEENEPVPAAEPVAAAPVVTADAPAVEVSVEEPAKVVLSFRLELRDRMLKATPDLLKAVQTYRRTVATVRRASSPRRQPGPWRSDREVFEQAQGAVAFAQKLVDAYGEAWNDAAPRIDAGTVAAEAERFLAWTQLDRYIYVSQGAPGSQPPAVREAAPGVRVSERPEAEAAPSEPPATPAAPEGDGATA